MAYWMLLAERLRGDIDYGQADCRVRDPSEPHQVEEHVEKKGKEFSEMETLRPIFYDSSHVQV